MSAPTPYRPIPAEPPRARCRVCGRRSDGSYAHDHSPPPDPRDANFVPGLMLAAAVPLAVGALMVLAIVGAS